jgi:hypothetical protein
MLDQQRLVGANGVVTQGTVTIVVTVGVQVNTAVAKVVVKLRHSARLEVAVTVTTYGERVHILGVRNQTFLAHQRRAARTFGLHLVRSHVTEEDRVIANKLFGTDLALGEVVVLTAVLFQVRARDNFVACHTFVEWFFGVRSHVTEEDRVIATKLFRTILALGEIVVLTAVLFQVRARDNFVACQTFVEWFFGVRSHVSKKVCPIGIDGLATDLALWKSVRFTAVGFQEIPTRNNFVARHTFCGWFVVVRGQMTIEVDVVGIDGLAADLALWKSVRFTAVGFQEIPTRDNFVACQTFCGWFVVVRGQMTIEVDVVGIDGLATATNGEIVTLNCMFELFATDNLRVACCESTLFNRVGLIDMFFKHP